MVINIIKIVLIILTVIIVGCKSGEVKAPDHTVLNLTQYVDPYIGSSGHGHVFVGANVPFGGVQVGPSNFYKGWDWSSAYHYSDTIVRGFAHLHLSGTGVGDLGDISVMAATGELKINAGTQDHPKEGYASKYYKNTEVVKPGYYKVNLDRYNIKVELTATERAAIHRYTFPKAAQSRIIIDMGEGNSDRTTDSYIKKVNDSVFVGYRFSTGWANDQREYFALQLSKSIADFHLYNRVEKINANEGKGDWVKGFLEFSTKNNEEVYLKVGISAVSTTNALKNLEAEIPHWNFNKIALDADKKWNKELAKIKIKTRNLSHKRTFYTALYHTMMAPTIFNDVNGEYRGTDKKNHKDPGFTNYTLFSLWDTYRAAHPLYTITQPERVSDMVNSMLLIFMEQGKLPVWHLRANENNTMTGYSAVPVIVDACLKGFKGIDLELAYEAVKTTATGDFEPGVKDLMKYGYIPGDHGPESVASAMEYAISDWAIAQLAQKLGKTEDAKYFAKRAVGYKEYFDPETKFMRGKMKDGSRRTPFNPISAQHRVNDYCEGNAWQYLWMVPQDPEGLIELLGGDRPFIHKLDELFRLPSELDEGASVDITGLIGQYAHGNEPSHQTTYMYTYAGAQYKTAEKVDYILHNLYSDSPNGLSGNEDCGQMSAWYVFSAMGFYSVNPANGMYVFGRPLFDEVSIKTELNNVFRVLAENNSAENKYIQSVTLNGKPYSKAFITHKEIIGGGTLKFVMGAQPNKAFGNKIINRPKSILY